MASVVTGVAVSVAAVGAVLTGAVSVRIVYSGVTQTRRDAARERAEQAQSFGATISRVRREHRVFTAAMGSRLVERDRTIGRLEGTLRLSEHRADEAESRAEREARRADEAEEQLSALLDEVLSQPVMTVVDQESDEVSTIVDLLAWEGRATQAVSATVLSRRR